MQSRLSEPCPQQSHNVPGWATERRAWCQLWLQPPVSGMYLETSAPTTESAGSSNYHFRLRQPWFVNPFSTRASGGQVFLLFLPSRPCPPSSWHNEQPLLAVPSLTLSTQYSHQSSETESIRSKVTQPVEGASASGDPNLTPVSAASTFTISPGHIHTCRV